MAVEFKAIDTEGAARQIARQIRASILSGKLKVDERLPTEEELAQQFKVSRPTVREALKILGAQNLIRSRRGSSGGTFVRLPSKSDVREQLSSITSVLVSMGQFSIEDIFEARLELEQICCRIAAVKRTESDLKAMAMELEYQRNEEITDIEFCASDVRFHTLLAEATQNSVLEFLMVAISETLQPILNMVVYPFRERQFVVTQHQKILTALTKKDAQVAAEALIEQMAYLAGKYQEAHEWRTRNNLEHSAKCRRNTKKRAMGHGNADKTSG